MKNKSVSQLHSVFIVFLFIILLIGVFLFYIASGNPQQQYSLVLFFALVYFLWGVIYHMLKGDFHLKIVVEYLLIAIFAVLLAKGAIFH
jgi:hypothetical protein